MTMELLVGILIPFAGTALGAACVLFLKKQINERVRRGLSGFSAGVMAAASVWSLLIPSLEQAADMGIFAFVPAVAGFWFGVLFLLILDTTIPHLHTNREEQEGGKYPYKKTTMLILAVILHNIPEGMAVGVIFAGLKSGTAGITWMGAMALSFGIAIQNLPEGAIVSMPLCSEGAGRGKAFWYGVLSGVVEPVAAFLTIWASGMVVPVLPYLLSFAAGVMMYVVVEDLIPDMSFHKPSYLGTVVFTIGFTLMMTLDTTLG